MVAVEFSSPVTIDWSSATFKLVMATDDDKDHRMHGVVVAWLREDET